MDELNYNGFSNEENEIKSFGELNNTTGENVDANINGDVVENAAQYAAENIIENVDADVGENAAEGFGENVIENAAVGVADKRVENEKTYEGSFVDLKSASYYSESYTKPKKRKNSVLLQMILVAVMSSILGGSIVGVSLYWSSGPQSFVQSIFRNTNVQNGSNDATSGVDTDYYKKVVIENNADSSVVVAIAEKVGPSVVGISVKSTTSISDFWFFTPRDTESQGSAL